MTRASLAFCVAATLLLDSELWPLASSAQVPMQFIYQGRLTDAEGVPVTDTNTTATIHILKGGSGLLTRGEPVFTQIVKNAVFDAGGVFSTPIGDGSTNFLFAIHDGSTSNRYIETVVNNETNLPRQQLVAVPYAIAAHTIVSTNLWVDPATGNVGVGVVEPDARLQVDGSLHVNSRGNMSEKTPLSIGRGLNPSNEVMWVYTEDHVGAFRLIQDEPDRKHYFRFYVENPNGEQRLMDVVAARNPADNHVNVYGDIRSNGSSILSDARMKEDVQLIANALKRVRKLDGVTYRVSRERGSGEFSNAPRQVGLLGQQVGAVMPEAVVTADDGTLSVRYANLVALLVEAMKEQQEQIEALEERIQGIEP